MAKKEGEFATTRLAVPVESKRNCKFCYYFSRGRFQSGRWPCNNPSVYPGRVGSDYPCFAAKDGPPPEERRRPH